MSTRSIFLASLILIIFVSSTQSARQKSGNDGYGIPGVPGFGSGIPGGRYFGGGIIGPVIGGIGDIVHTTITCREKGPCNGKKLRCPAKCYTYFSHSRQGFEGGGVGGGCAIDCTNKCVAVCSKF